MKITTLQEVEHALSFCDANMSFADWQKIGTALAGHFGHEAFDLFDSWSSAGSNYSAKAVSSYWKGWLRNNNPNRPTLASVAWMASQAGWRPDRSGSISPEERARRDKEHTEREARRQKEQEAARLEAEQALSKHHRAFLALKRSAAPTEYMLAKRIDPQRASALIDLRYGDKAGFLGRMFCWPLYDDDPRVNPSAEFCGYERVFERRNDLGRNKFLTSHGKNDRGFGVFGAPLNQASRAFICGGFADGYSAHIATGETMIVVVGESNIPRIKQHLHSKYPQLTLIVSPDNDKAGKAQVQKAGGFWSLPEQEGYDWSDVYIKQGPDELKRQLLNVRGIEVNQVCQRHLDVAIAPGLNFIRSGKETGKTFSAAEWSREHREHKTLVISYRRNLLQSLRVKFDADYYEELILAERGDDIDRNMMLRQSMRLVITPDSLWRLQGSTWDVVIVDEADQTLMHFLSDTMLKAGRQVLNCEMFAHLLQSAHTQVLMDADLSNLTTEFCSFIGLHSGVMHHNTFKPREGSVLYVYESPNHMQAQLKDRLLRGEKHYFCANSKAQIQKFDEVLAIAKKRGHWNGDWFSVCSDNSSDDMTGEVVRYINTAVQKWDALLASPSWGTGISIDAGHPFQATWGRFNSHTGTSEQAHQQLARARGITEYHVYLDPTERNEPIDPDTILRLNLAEPDAETAKLLKLEEGQLAFTSSIFEWIYCHVTAALNLSRNQFSARFLAQAEEEGYTVVHVLKNKLAVSQGKQDMEEAGDRLRRLDMLSMIDANLLDKDQLRDAMHGDIDQTQSSIIKSLVYQDLNLQAMTDEHVDHLIYDAAATFRNVTAITTEFGDDVITHWPADRRELVIDALAFEQQQNRTVTAIKRLAVAAMPEDLAKAMDIKERKFAESRANLHHYAKRRQHLLRILRAVGIDEQLNYSGATWSAEQINRMLRAWMLRNRESLYKYSGVTLTDNALKQPLQWLHEFLRRHGLEVEQVAKKRMEGKEVRFYGIETGQLTSVRILAQLRIAGIQAALLEGEELRHPAQAVYREQQGQGVAPIMQLQAAPALALKGSEGESGVTEISSSPVQYLDLTTILHHAAGERICEVVRHIEQTPGLTDNQAATMASTILNQYDLAALPHRQAGPLYRAIANAIAIPSSAMGIIRRAANTAQCGILMAIAELSDMDMADLATGDWSEADLVTYLQGIKRQQMEWVG